METSENREAKEREGGGRPVKMLTMAIGGLSRSLRLCGPPRESLERDGREKGGGREMKGGEGGREAT